MTTGGFVITHKWNNSLHEKGTEESEKLRKTSGSTIDAKKASEGIVTWGFSVWRSLKINFQTEYFEDEDKDKESEVSEYYPAYKSVLWLSVLDSVGFFTVRSKSFVADEFFLFCFFLFYYY